MLWIKSWISQVRTDWVFFSSLFQTLLWRNCSTIQKSKKARDNGPVQGVQNSWIKCYLEKCISKSNLKKKKKRKEVFSQPQLRHSSSLVGYLLVCCQRGRDVKQVLTHFFCCREMLWDVSCALKWDSFNKSECCWNWIDAVCMEWSCILNMKFCSSFFYYLYDCLENI